VRLRLGGLNVCGLRCVCRCGDRRQLGLVFVSVVLGIVLFDLVDVLALLATARAEERQNILLLLSEIVQNDQVLLVLLEPLEHSFHAAFVRKRAVLVGLKALQVIA